MTDLLAGLLLYLGAVLFMEGFAWVMHRYVMHGFLWVWHRSHHEPRTGLFELNDLFAVVFAAPAIIAIWLGVRGVDWLLPVGLGITTDCTSARSGLFVNDSVPSSLPFDPFHATSFGAVERVGIR